jgi:hypothetical protein
MLPRPVIDSHNVVSITKKERNDALTADILLLETYLRQWPQADMPVTHRFAPGVYIRELFIPQGTLLTGAIHKTEHISILLTGRLVFPDGNGGSVEVGAGTMQLTQPGVKQAALALEDTRYLTIHATEETDIDVLEDMLVTNDPALVWSPVE